MTDSEFYGFTFFGCRLLGRQLAQAQSSRDMARGKSNANQIRDCLKRVPQKFRAMAFEEVFAGMKNELTYPTRF